MSVKFSILKVKRMILIIFGLTGILLKYFTNKKQTSFGRDAFRYIFFALPLGLSKNIQTVAKPFSSIENFFTLNYSSKLPAS